MTHSHIVSIRIFCKRSDFRMSCIESINSNNTCGFWVRQMSWPIAKCQIQPQTCTSSVGAVGGLRSSLPFIVRPSQSLVFEARYLHKLNFWLCLSLESKWDPKEATEKPTKHVSGISHIWALLDRWWKAGQLCMTATLPRGMSFLIVSSSHQRLAGVDQMNARLWAYHAVHLILVRHRLAGTLIKTYDGYRISKAPSQIFLTLGKGLSKVVTGALHLKRSWN